MAYVNNAYLLFVTLDCGCNGDGESERVRDPSETANMIEEEIYMCYCEIENVLILID